jgi:hypothetical protein
VRARDITRAIANDNPSRNVFPGGFFCFDAGVNLNWAGLRHDLFRGDGEPFYRKAPAISNGEEGRQWSAAFDVIGVLGP